MKIKMMVFVAIAAVALFTFAYTVLGQSNTGDYTGQQWDYLYFIYSDQLHSGFSLTEDDETAASLNDFSAEIQATHSDDDPAVFIDYISVLGNNGWELVSTEFQSEGIRMIFKRPSQE